MKPLFATVLMLMSCHAAIADSGDQIARGSSWISLDPATADACAPTIVEHYSRHSVVWIGNKPKPRYALVTQSFEVGRGCFEGFRPAVANLDARIVDVRTGKTDAMPFWSLNTEGTTGGVADQSHGELFRIDMPGCCGANDTAKYFSLFTGKLVASSTGPLLVINGTTVHDMRYISVEDNIASSPQVKKGAMATIFIGDSEALRETLAISSTDAMGGEDWWVASFNFVGKETSLTTQSVSHFDQVAVQLVLRCRCEYGPISINVPLSGEGFRHEKLLVTGSRNVTVSKMTHNHSFQRTAYGVR